MTNKESYPASRKKGGKTKALLVFFLVVAAFIAGVFAVPYLRPFLLRLLYPTTDLTPPRISEVSVASVKTSIVTITWTTDESANSTIFYGKRADNLEYVASDSSFNTEHSTTIRDLQPISRYHFKIVVWDKAGNRAESDVRDFETGSPSITQWGICFHPEAGWFGYDFEQIATNNITWVRMDFSWTRIEPQQGNYEFDFYEDVVGEAQSNGIEILGIVGNGFVGEQPEWVKDAGGIENPNYPDWVGNLTFQVISRFGDRVKYWQIENELNHWELHKLAGWREGEWTDDRIRSVLIRATEAAKRGDPDCIRLINVECDNLNWEEFLTKVRDWGISYEGVGLDFYPNYLDRTGDPEKADWIEDRILAAKEFKSLVIVTETGYSTYDAVHNEEKQVAFIKRVIEGSQNGGVQGLFVYSYVDRAISTDIEDNFGLKRNDRTSKPAWYEYGNLIAYWSSLLS